MNTKKRINSKTQKAIKEKSRLHSYNSSNDINNMRCPYCGAKMEYRSANGIYKCETDVMLYVCRNYPECDSYAKTKLSPSGKIIVTSTPANARLRALRTETHYYFDKMVQYKIFTDKQTAYRWLADRLSLGFCSNFTHIGEMNEYCCQKTIEESIKILKTHGIKVYPYYNTTFNYTRSRKELLTLINA